MILVILFFFFNVTSTTEIYTLSLHDALPIYGRRHPPAQAGAWLEPGATQRNQRRADLDAVARRAGPERPEDRKSTRLNSSHSSISYAVFCLKKKKNTNNL